jgi:hypothetical protein
VQPPSLCCRVALQLSNKQIFLNTNAAPPSFKVVVTGTRTEEICLVSCSLQTILVLTNDARKNIRVGASTMEYHLLEEQFAHRMYCLSPRLVRLTSVSRHNVSQFCISTGFGFSVSPFPDHASGVCNRPIPVLCRSQKSLTSAWINHQCFARQPMPLLLPFSHWRRCVSISLSPFQGS